MNTAELSVVGVFCQNHDIAHQKNGFDLTPEQLGEWLIKLEEVGRRAHDMGMDGLTRRFRSETCTTSTS